MKSHGHRYAGDARFTPRNGRRFGSIFSPPSPSLPPPAPPPPTVDDPSVEEARRKRRLVEARRRGRQATILTSGTGDESTATVNRPGLRRLLGGG
mgnify:FL=1